MDQITRLIPQGLARIAKQAQAAQAAVAQQGGLETAKRFWKNHGQLKFGKLMGEDSFGNKYYEDTDAPEAGPSINGRHRWVEYNTLNRYGTSGSRVPPEWHSWLHYVSDAPAPVLQSQYPTNEFAIPHQENQTGTSRSYAPSNYMKKATYDPLQARGAADSSPQPVSADTGKHKKYSAEEL